MHTKLFTALFWAVSACLIMWLFSLAQRQTASFESFWLFSFMLLGGGASYHFLVELLQLPHHAWNSEEWQNMNKAMLLFMLPLLSIPVVSLAAKSWLAPPVGFLAVYAYLLVAFGVASWRAFKVERIFRLLRSIERGSAL